MVSGDHDKDSERKTFQNASKGPLPVLPGAWYESSAANFAVL
jgi:hypothetical protein